MTIMIPDNRRAAIVLLEFQNKWTEPPGLFHRLIKNDLATHNVMENVKKLLNTARSRDINVIHAPLVVDPKNKRGWYAHVTFGKMFRKGSHAAKIDKRVYDPDYDHIVEGRTGFDGFLGSNLEQMLRRLDIQQVFMGGFASDQCVAKTHRTALKRGFDSYFVTDITATFANAIHSSLEKRLGEHVVFAENVRLAIDANQQL